MKKIGKVEVEKGLFLERKNRFVGRVKIGGKFSDVHIANTGRLTDVLIKGVSVLVYRINSKLKFRLFGTHERGKYYNILDTIMQNKMFEEIIERGLLKEFKNCKVVKRNPRVGNSTFDFLLLCGDETVIVETKSAVLRDKEKAMYPDCPSIRGRRHLEELISLYEKDKNVALVFIAALPYVKCFKPYEKGDQVLAGLIYKAKRIDMKLVSFSVFSDEKGNIYFDKTLSFCYD